MPDERPTVGTSRSALTANAVLATLAAVLALAPAALETTPWLALLAVPVQALGGIAYHAVVTLDRGPAPPLLALWRLQTLVSFGLGVPLAALALRDGREASALASAGAWLLLAAMFVVGLYAWERVVSRWSARAALD